MRHCMGLLAGVSLLAGIGAPGLARGAYPTVRQLPGAPPNVSGFVVTSPQGVHVFVDAVAVPDELAAALQDPRSVLLVTGRQPDHYSERLAEAFKGQKLLAEPGRLESGDVRVEAIAASRSGDKIDGSDVIMVIQVAGARVVHLGDCGQARLTPEQLARIGRADLLLQAIERLPTEAELVSRQQFRDRGYSDVQALDERPFRLLGQLRPTILVPTHLATPAAAALLARIQPAEAARRAEVALSPEVLARGPRVVFTGANVALARQAGIAPSTEL